MLVNLECLDFFSPKEVGKSAWLLHLSFVNIVLLVPVLSVMDSREEKVGPEVRDWVLCRLLP